MNKIAEDFSAEKVWAIFIFTNEAHPGENYPHLTSMEQKARHAKALRDLLGVSRPILLDSLDGVYHRYLGSMPNMTWIFNRSGIPLYKSDWTDANSVRNSLEYLLDVVKRRNAGECLAPFSVERLDYRESDRVAFYERLAVNNPNAVEEFRKVFGENKSG